MAIMIPAADASHLEHSSEAPVYEALRTQLGEEFTVLHSYPWLRRLRGGGKALAEGEADFVVLHPQRGLLVLEVKGGKTIRYDGKSWYRDIADGPKKFKDPFVQARRNMHALLDIAEERSGGRVARSGLVYGYAVVFPHMDYEGAPPPQSDKAIIISRGNLPFMDQAIETAFRAWTEEPRALPADRYSMLLHDCLMPRFGIFRPIGPDIAIDVDRLLELTETQAEVFEGLYAQDRVLVEGVAGSGKTFLALMRAVAFAREGKRTLFVCFNRELATWLDRQVEDDPSIRDFSALLTVRNFHAFAADLATKAGIKFSPANGGPLTQAFWDYEVPDLMEQAVLALSNSAGEPVHFDAIVVDEAQDFPTGWWYALTQSLLVAPDGPIYAFLDPNQSLRGSVEWPPIDFDSRFRLNLNCRNTRRIAAASASILDLRSGVYARAPIGGKPRILRARTAANQKGLVLEEVRKLLQREVVSPEQIAIVGPAAKANSSLATIDNIDGVPLVTSAGDWRDGAGLLVTTARAFKGLEADIVILYDLGGFSPLFTKQDLYVASTRAKVVLISIVHGQPCREVMEAAVSASELG